MSDTLRPHDPFSPDSALDVDPPHAAEDAPRHVIVAITGRPIVSGPGRRIMTRTLDASGRVKPMRFAHFVLRVTDLQASIAFYQRLIGMEVVHESPFVAFLTYDDEHHRLALVTTPVREAAPPGAAGLDHVAYTFESMEALLGNYLRLKNEGILPAWSINHGPTTSLYYADPDGNRIEFQIENFETEQQFQAFVESEAFQKNPIGVEFDPDRLVARFEAGEAIDELKRQGTVSDPQSR